ncbi:MAG TPA: NADH-quinone oxidoreductase subunit A [Chloroflexota bacterium]
MQTVPLWPLGVYFLAVIGLNALIIILSYILGPRHMDRVTGEPFESGIRSTGTTFLRFDIKYYLVAMFFVVFDLETAFLLTWAVGARENGWSGYVEMLIFAGVLVAGLIYLWRLGALDWAAPSRTRRRAEMMEARSRSDHAGR